jgi:peptidoglycan/LPS O-acetylase OafA/YrhL
VSISSPFRGSTRGSLEGGSVEATVRSPDADGRRSYGLDAVRAIACAMVVICHASLYAGDGTLAGLKNGVMLFFALSGYLLYRPFVDGWVDLRRYATHRVARILPAYLVALVGLTLLTNDRSFLEHPTTYLLFGQNYDPTLWQGFLGVSWTLVLEVQFYLVLPLLALIVAGSPARLALLASVSLFLAVALLTVPGQGDARILSSTFPAMVWAFTPGMFVALLERRAPWLSQPWTLLAGIALLVVGTGSWWASVDLASGAGSFLIVGWTVTRRPSLGVVAPIAAAGAAITYSAYLWHIDVIRTVGSGLPMALVLIALAGAIYIAVERPILRAARRATRARREDTASVGVAAV